MTDAHTPNPFAPPRAHVEDPYAPQSAEMVAATRGSRFLAVLVDVSPVLVIGVIAAIIAAATMPGMLSGRFDPAAGGMMAFGLFFLVVGVGTIGWAIWNIVLLYKYGQTVGKKVLGIRVVRMDGRRVSFARFFFLRWLSLAVIGGVVGAIGGAIHAPLLGNIVSLIDCLMIFGAARRCLHDLIADTKVVTAASSPNATLEGAASAR